MHKLLLTVGDLFLISGLFNLRGNDIPYNPFFYSYTLLTMDEIWWGLLSGITCVNTLGLSLSCSISSHMLGYKGIFHFYHISQAVPPHGQSDGWVEGVPERLLWRAPLCAAEKLRQCPRSAEDVRGPAWGQSVDRHRVHKLRTLWDHYTWGM